MEDDFVFQRVSDISIRLGENIAVVLVLRKFLEGDIVIGSGIQIKAQFGYNPLNILLELVYREYVFVPVAEVAFKLLLYQFVYKVSFVVVDQLAECEYIKLCYSRVIGVTQVQVYQYIVNIIKFL